MTNETASTARLTADDLIVDQALRDLEGDRLNHRVIAARVADLVCAAETPANVALFAPWGSGKSSFGGLLEAQLKARRADARVITYNAWTYGGESLQRNFIANTARSLGLDPETNRGRPYFGGLYEKNKGARLRLSREALQPIFALAISWMVAILLTLVAVTAFIAWAAGQDVVKAVTDLIPQVLPSAGVASLIAALVQVGVTNARVEVEQGAPTQEQLRDTFSRLVKQETKSALHGGPARLVFFVDELDRCDKGSIVEVLRSVRGFFGEDRCVFVVAADRRVLEDALTELPQSTPVDTENPYYSSASEFFDKVFQFQMSLPPLRGGRLTRFARDLVDGRTRGLWGELRSMPDGERLVDLVIHDVVPSHVRSPRRVKILLNNFATNVRIAESRGIVWSGRAREIAKLTALQTEFPLFAADLFLEPRLPSLLLDPPTQRSARMQELLAKHRLPAARGAVVAVPVPATEGTEPTTEDDVEATDATPDVDPSRVHDLHVSQRRLLASYLARVQDVPDPRRDLLYLAPAGPIVDLADPGLANELEDLAVDSSERAIALLDGQPPVELAKAVRLLAEQGHQEFGLERLSVVSTMLGAAAQADYELGASVADALRLLQVAIREEGLLPEQLPGALVLADRSPLGGTLSRSIMGDARLLDGAERTIELTKAGQHLTPTHRKELFAFVAKSIGDNLDLFAEPAAALPLATTEELLSACSGAILKMASEAGDEDDAEQLAAATIDVIAGRPDATSSMLNEVVAAVANGAQPDGYGPLASRANDLVDRLTDAFADWVRLRLIAIAPATERVTWASGLHPEVPKGIANFHVVAGRAATAVFEDLTGADAGSDPEPVIRAMLPHLAQTQGKVWEGVGPSVTAALARAYAADRQGPQHTLDRAALLVAGIDDDLRDRIAPLVVDDLVRPLQARGTFSAGMAGIRALAPRLLPGQHSALDAAVSASPFAPANRQEVVLTRAHLAAAAFASGDLAFATLRPSPDEIKEAGPTDELVAFWLGAGPDVTEVLTVLPMANSAVTKQAFGRWAGQQTAQVRTAAVLGLLDKDESVGTAALHTVAGELDEPGFVDGILKRLRRARTGEGRRDLVKHLVAAHIETPDGNRRAVDVIEYLLSLRQKGDDESARTAMVAVGRGHGSRQRLEGLIAAKADEPDDRWRRAMDNAGLRQPAKRSLLPRR